MEDALTCIGFMGFMLQKLKNNVPGVLVTSVNPRFELPTVFIIKYFTNPSMEYSIPICWPSVSTIVQKHRGTRFSPCSCHCKTASNSVCLSERATVTKGGGA